MQTQALKVHITGIVQGVGFRPFVYNLAVRLGIVGWVINSSDGVHCLIQGSPESLRDFLEALRREAPPMSVIEDITAEDAPPGDFGGFTIGESQAVADAITLVSPDIATCDMCVSELFDPADRRSGYPFINCTNCGPRFTIIDDVPYDRPSTTMKVFGMCPDCSAEYADPADRRFHAQPDACFVCGPRLYLNVTNPEAGDNRSQAGSWEWTPDVESVPRPHRHGGSERKRSNDILTAVISLLEEGAIIAIKGLGGFHLACDASNESAVKRLRERKHRWGKPLAVMVPDLSSAGRLCVVSDAEEALLAGTTRPIVLMRRHDGEGGLAPSVSGDLPEIGVMLPYTPLHHLLLARMRRPLVMTSGNLSEEPIATGNAEALSRLARIADGFLLHDRDIHSRYDDSVFRVVADVVEPVRRARGYAPYPLRLPGRSQVDILAVGPEQKNTFTLVRAEHAFVSQHIGDMENRQTLEHFEQTIDLYSKLFRVKPQLVSHDLHPEYLSTKYATQLDLPKVGVQHHHAHVVSVTAEHALSSRVTGIAFDGTGFGSDGRIWGGEVLLADWSEFERFAHLAYVPMPGGAAAIRRPARMAIGTLHATGLLDHPGAGPLRQRLREGEEELLLKMVDQGINSPLTSSMGRLFDTVAAIAGVRDDAAYEGEAAIELEACADRSEAGAYAFGFLGDGEATVVDPEPVLRAVLDDVARGVSAAVISARFHAAVVCVIVDLARRAADLTGVRDVALSGGVFMNRIVLEGALRDLGEAGFSALTHKRLPTNDGAVSFGQAVVAWTRSRQ